MTAYIETYSRVEYQWSMATLVKCAAIMDGTSFHTNDVFGHLHACTVTFLNSGHALDTRTFLDN